MPMQLAANYVAGSRAAWSRRELELDRRELELRELDDLLDRELELLLDEPFIMPPVWWHESLPSGD
jgi:hypothetical protein